ncbi:RnfH family protein [Halothiobacillus sp. DCM-1]|uniref:RnfH family protein n=1 Tax=Halothiobacillus sp. DCM-1 TaxID=3112558 RepID=UPI0032527174
MNPPDSAAMIPVEVAYARPDRQVILTVSVPADATAQQAIERSGILAQFPEIDLSKNKIGIFSRLVPLTQSLQAQDRIEIYRALIADPKAARRERAARAEDE